MTIGHRQNLVDRIRAQYAKRIREAEETFRHFVRDVIPRLLESAGGMARGIERGAAIAIFPAGLRFVDIWSNPAELRRVVSDLKLALDDWHRLQPLHHVHGPQSMSGWSEAANLENAYVTVVFRGDDTASLNIFDHDFRVLFSLGSIGFPRSEHDARRIMTQFAT